MSVYPKKDRIIWKLKQDNKKLRERYNNQIRLSDEYRTEIQRLNRRISRLEEQLESKYDLIERLKSNQKMT